MPVVAAAAVTGAAAIYGATQTSDANTKAAQTGSAAAVQAAQIQADAAKQAAQTASDANRAAADAQLKAAEDALAFQKSVYVQKQAQVAPYIGAGQGAVSALSAGLGVTPVPQAPPVMPPSNPAGIDYGISPPSTSFPAGSSSAARATTTAPTLANLGMPSSQPSTGSAPTSVTNAPTVGTQRLIQGTPAIWDGTGWKAAPNQSASSVQGAA